MATKKLPIKPLPFEEAIKFFKDKVPMTADEYKALATKAKAKAFSVAGVTRLDILQDILDELRFALEAGQTLREFQKSVQEKMSDKGWTGATPYRLDTIFRTNIQTAYMAGRYQQMNSPAVVETRPYWMYSAVKDGSTRPSHKALDGMVRPHDDPIWDIWYPPNGFRCRCKVIALSPGALKRRGLEVQENGAAKGIDKETGEILKPIPDKGFDHNPGKEDWKPDLKRYDPDLKKLYKDKSNNAL